MIGQLVQILFGDGFDAGLTTQLFVMLKLDVIVFGIKNDKLIMNCFKDTVLKNDTVTSEGFPVLKPGENSITCAGNVRRIEIVPRWRCL